jgi:hypothetical protein
MCCAAKAIGNSELEAKFTEGIILKFIQKLNANSFCF